MGGVVGGGIGVGTLVIAVIAYFLGIDPTTVIDASQQLQQAAPSQQQRGKEGAPTDQMGQFVSKVLASTEDVWTQLFRANGRQYRDPKLILYTGSTRTACGVGQAAMGPFYCPNDEQLYIDLAFYDDLRKRFGAPGDFAQAYVIAHEIGHHVQKQLGIMDRLQQGSSRSQHNQMSVRVELQADCFAGVWGHHAANAHLLDPGDMEEALAAATAIGDDRLQKQSQGYVVPESFTHGTSAQRVRWFKRGMDTGKVSECDTFNSQVL
jgi:hypothetical protein